LTKESSWYQPIEEALSTKFGEKFHNCHLEITAGGKFSAPLKQRFDEPALFFIAQHKYPDLMGFVFENSTEYFITVEIKDEKPTIDHIYEAKMYAELFKARFGFLISTEPLAEEIKRLGQSRNALFKHEGWAYQKVICGEFDKNAKRLLDYKWFPEKPF